MVRAPRSVWTVSIVVYFPPTFFTIVSVPSPFELNARPVLGSAAWIPSRRCSIGSRFSGLFLHRRQQRLQPSELAAAPPR
jgi:hypothetical protein